MIPIRDDAPRFSTPYITYFIIALNTVVFLYESLLAATPRGLVALLFQFGVVPSHVTAALGAGSDFNPGAAVLPIFTSMFLHASWLHVGGNMLFLWIFGDNIEDYLGHFKYLVFYLASGVAASFLHILLNLNSRVPSVGASGAIAGVMGGYLVLYPRARVLVWFPILFLFHLPAWLMLGYWFVVQFLSGTATAIARTSQTSGGVAFWAHVGGFVAGIVMIKVIPPRPRRFSYR
jgi:rhomboid family protein